MSLPRPRPTELEFYLSTNDVLPQGLIPIFDAYLADLRVVLGEGDKPQADPTDPSIGEEHPVLVEYRKCRGITNPVRRMPAELLAIIFGLAVGVAPHNRYSDVCRLRGVCVFWRQVALTTSGLWDGLSISVNQWCPPTVWLGRPENLKRDIEDRLTPWLSILTRPYTLRLDLHGSKGVSPSLCRNILVRHLLSVEPSPRTICIGSSQALSSITSSPGASPSVLCLELLEDAGTTRLNRLEDIFPALAFLEINALLIISFPPPFRHSTICALHLDKLQAEPRTFSEFLHGLPSLQELKACTVNSHYIDDEGWDTSRVSYTHHSLELLFLTGEDLLLALQHVSLPNLRLLSLHGHPLFFMGDADTVTLPGLYSRTSPHQLFVVVTGALYQEFATRFLNSLPPSSHVFLDVSEIVGPFDDEEVDDVDNPNFIDPFMSPIALQSDHIEEIVCGQRTAAMWWLSPGPAREASSRSLPILSVQSQYRSPSKVDIFQDPSSYPGFDMRLCSPQEILSRLDALLPELSQYSKRW